MKENILKPRRSSSMKPEKPIPIRSKAKDEHDSEDNVVTFSYRRKSTNPNGLTIKNVNIIFNEDAMKVMNVQATETHLPKQTGSRSSPRISPARKLHVSPKLPESNIAVKNAIRHSTIKPTNSKSMRNINSYDHHDRDNGAISDDVSLVSKLECVRDNSSELCTSLSLLNMIGSDNSEQIDGCEHFPVTPVSRTHSLANYIADVKLPSIIEDSSAAHNYSQRLRSATNRRLTMLDSDGYVSSNNSTIKKHTIQKRKQPMKKRRKRKIISNKGVKLRTNNGAIITDKNEPSRNVPVIAEIHEIPLSHSNQSLGNSELGTIENDIHNSGFESTSGNSEYYTPRRHLFDKSLNMQKRSFITDMKQSLHSFEQTVGHQINLHANRLEQISGERAKIFRTICDLEKKLVEQRSKFLANMNEAELCSSNLVDVIAKHSEQWEKIKDQTSNKWIRVHRIYSSDYE